MLTKRFSDTTICADLDVDVSFVNLLLFNG